MSIFLLSFFKVEAKEVGCFCFCFSSFVTGKQATVLQNEDVIKIFLPYLPIFLKPLQPKAFVSVWGQH